MNEEVLYSVVISMNITMLKKRRCVISNDIWFDINGIFIYFHDFLSVSHIKRIQGRTQIHWIFFSSFYQYINTGKISNLFVSFDTDMCILYDILMCNLCQQSTIYLTIFDTNIGVSFHASIFIRMKKQGHQMIRTCSRILIWLKMIWCPFSEIHFRGNMHNSERPSPLKILL